MSRPANESESLNAEAAKLLKQLAHGSAILKTKTSTAFKAIGANSHNFEVSISGLGYAARKGWVKREGATISLTDAAPVSEFALKSGAVASEIIENGERRTVMRVAVESPIDYLVSRKDKNGLALLSQPEWSAGDRLRTDFTLANMLPSIGMRWGEPLRSKGSNGENLNPTETSMSARLRVKKALDAVGPEFSGLLIDVCCFLKGLEQVEMERSWPQRSAKVMLRAGLSILARHYAPASKAASKTHIYATPDYRPSLKAQQQLRL